MLKKNMHNIDRAIRVVIGLVLIWLGFVDQALISNQLISWAIGLFGFVNLVSAAAAFCPVYFAAGFSTRREPA